MGLKFLIQQIEVALDVFMGIGLNENRQRSRALGTHGYELPASGSSISEGAK
jgi:hypothetical protein